MWSPHFSPRVTRSAPCWWGLWNHLGFVIIEPNRHVVKQSLRPLWFHESCPFWTPWLLQLQWSRDKRNFICNKELALACQPVCSGSLRKMWRWLKKMDYSVLIIRDVWQFVGFLPRSFSTGWVGAPAPASQPHPRVVWQRQDGEERQLVPLREFTLPV